jgi:acyl carrier protein
MSEQLLDIIRSIRPELDFPAGQDVNLFGVLDSLDIIFLVDEIEKQLSVSIDADQIVPENFASLYTLNAFVKGKLK